MCDTNVLLRAAISPAGPVGELLRILAEDHVLVSSAHHLSELLEVLRRPRVLRFHGLDDQKIQRYISRLYKMSVIARLPEIIPAVDSRDPKDDPIVMTAVAGNADVLCTLDRHLHDPSVAEYCAGPGIRILKDDELRELLRAI
jgi:uncharacterized protein